MPSHAGATTTELHLPGYVTDSDPGAIGAGMYWQRETTPFTLKKRNSTNTGWDTVSAGASAGTVTNVTGTAPISVATGTSTPVITHDAIGTAGTYTKVTTDAKGHVSSGTTLIASDIPNLDTAKITTGTLAIARGGTNAATASANQAFMGPTSGGAVAPAFRALVNADIPALLANLVQTTLAVDTTLDATHCAVAVDSNAAPVTITLPAASGCGGRVYVISGKDGSNGISLTTTGGDKLGHPAGSTSKGIGTGDCAILYSDGTATWMGAFVGSSW